MIYNEKNIVIPYHEHTGVDNGVVDLGDMQGLLSANATIASDVLKVSSDTQRSGNSPAYSTLKQITMYSDGYMRASFDYRFTGTPGVADPTVRILKNYNDESVELTEVICTGSSQTETVDFHMRKGEYLLLQGKRVVAGHTYIVKNFRIYYTAKRYKKDYKVILD